ncbi:hypothetical protein EVAR_98882_1 [Eumeta japonica]|uniref:Uncharacterized protein n=1 Tax=Eumeta variegata TaxID=151549 RepID=A0A4C2AD65_EUMVA|nr:hypothetical protein EVAR_98882_1 [Eumeta japonica]
MQRVRIRDFNPARHRPAAERYEVSLCKSRVASVVTASRSAPAQLRQVVRGHHPCLQHTSAISSRPMCLSSHESRGLYLVRHGRVKRSKPKWCRRRRASLQLAPPCVDPHRAASAPTLLSTSWPAISSTSVPERP